MAKLKGLSSGELVERTGASYRQIDYWCHIELISPIGDKTPGSGNFREFDERIIERVRFLVNFSRAFDHSVRSVTLKKIYKEYNKGSIDLGEGIVLSWRNGGGP